MRWLYTILSPSLWLLDFVWPHSSLAISILFKFGKRKGDLIWNQAKHETGGFTNSNTQRKNYFSFAYVGSHWQVEGSKADTDGPGGEPVFAFYKTSFDSVGHLHEWISNRPEVANVLDSVAPGASRLDYNNYSAALKTRNYYQAGVTTYSNSLYHWSQSGPSFSPYIRLVVVLCINIFVLVFLRSYLLGRSYKA